MKAIAITFACLAVLVPSVARAEVDNGTTARPVAVAPLKAWEVTVGQGYSQGFGRANDGARLTDYARGGFSLQLGAGYRIDPRLFVGVYAEGSRYSASHALPDDSTAYGAAFGAQANWHLMPFSKLDPWIGVGSGARAYWIDSSEGPALSLYGVDIARLRIGADYRLGASTSIGPMLGATMTTFVTQQTAGSDPANIDAPGLSTAIFAGTQGRFDIGGARIPAEPRTLAAR
jgi:opacity protein-like surface antigen